MVTAIASATNPQGKPLYNTIGIELDNEAGITKASQINSGHFPFPCEDELLKAEFEKAVKRGNLRASTSESEYKTADIVLVDVNLDMIEGADGKTVAWEPFRKAIKTLGGNIRENTLIIVETTVPPGTCENFVMPILKECFTERGLNPDSILLAHSYERVMPGKNYLNSIRNFWRVYSAGSVAAEEECRHFLESVINTRDYPLTRLPSMRASETAKILENSYRAVNIAFIDEWTRFARAIDIDLFQVIDAIKMRPTHANMMQPGFGVGGYCLTKDPLFGAISSREFYNSPDIDFVFSAQAYRTNNDMPLYALARLQEMLGAVKDKRILVLGVSYRQDVGDTRCSPSETFARKLIGMGANMAYHDPYVEYWAEMNAEVLTSELPESQDFDAIVFAVSHQAYRQIDFAAWISNKNIGILDANNVLTERQRSDIRERGLSFYSIGR
jgi:nucleotide sugar dehydrogenase